MSFVFFQSHAIILFIKNNEENSNQSGGFIYRAEFLVPRYPQCMSHSLDTIQLHVVENCMEHSDSIVVLSHHTE